MGVSLQQTAGARADRREGQAYDARFRRLIGREAWELLPVAVQNRFSKRLSGRAVALYRGCVVETRFTALGWLLAQALRPIGAPLPLAADRDVPAVVSVSEDRASGGQTWTRIYGRHRRFPQVIHSAKRFAGSTGLEEYVGRGIGMALRVEAMADGLRFISDHYFLMLGHWRLRLPRWTEPGVTIVEHRDRGGGEFAFDLELRHRMFGVLVGQHAVFHDA